jgi:Glycosyl transferase family 2
MKICVVAIFKNESHVLKEWLEHYLREGVDTFLLIDNDSSDNYKPILEPFLRSKQVFLKKSKKKHAQVELYNRWLPEAKKFDWVIVVDMDEFIYARNGFKTIKAYLETVNKDIYKIEIPWKLFGSSGFKKQPNSVIQNFIHRKEFPKFNTNTNLSERVINIKTISRGPYKFAKRIYNGYIFNFAKRN